MMFFFTRDMRWWTQRPPGTDVLFLGKVMNGLEIGSSRPQGLLDDRDCFFAACQPVLISGVIASRYLEF